MNLTTDLKRAYSIPNLRRAWQRLLTNTELEYKNHFRDLYKAYGLASEDNLANLHDRLIREVYTAEHSLKLYVPKKSGLLRTFTLLSLEDQIVYQAYANVIADFLHPKACKNYGKLNFSNYYGGQTSLFFYKKWQIGYQDFTKNITQTFKSGLQYAASFDYTAFYDTIDHSVLSRLLEDLGLSKEFTVALKSCLSVWTCTDISRKYHGHGIPQGPVSSGMLAEVIMNYVDNCFDKKKLPIKYVRYADDIRLMSIDDYGVRKGVLLLDMISKRVGLFPQSGKIGIHKIQNIKDELKDISMPDVYSEDGELLKWNVVNAFIKNSKVTDETRFKYLLPRTESNGILEAICIKVLVNHPHLYATIINYLAKREVLTPAVSKRLLIYIQENNLYEEVVAKCLQVAYDKVHKLYRQDYIDFCLPYFIKLKDSASPNLRAKVIKWVLRETQIKYSDLLAIIENSEAWVTHNILSSIEEGMYGIDSYQVLLNNLLCSEDKEVSLSAACICIENGITVIAKPEVISSIAQRSLKKAGKILSLYNGSNTFTSSLNAILNTKFKECNWNKFLLQHAKTAERQLFLCRTFVQNDMTVFFNKLSIINELIIEHIFRLDTTLPAYIPGNFGGYVNSRTSQLAIKHWPFYLMCETVQAIRRDSDLAHAVNKRTKKPTGRVFFSDFRKNKQIIIEGYQYLVSFADRYVPSSRLRRKNLFLSRIVPKVASGL